MFPWNWDVSNSNFALMSTTDLDWGVLFGRDQVQTSLLFIFLFVADTLQYDVRFVGFGDGHHLNIGIVESNYLRKRKLTNLTFEFCKIIALGDSFDLLLHLAVDPSFKASHMNQSAAAFAVTGRYQRIGLALFVAEAYFAAAFSLFHGSVMFSYMLFNLEHAICLIKVICIS